MQGKDRMKYSRAYHLMLNGPFKVFFFLLLPFLHASYAFSAVWYLLTNQFFPFCDKVLVTFQKASCNSAVSGISLLKSSQWWLQWTSTAWQSASGREDEPSLMQGKGVGFQLGPHPLAPSLQAWPCSASRGGSVHRSGLPRGHSQWCVGVRF